MTSGTFQKLRPLNLLTHLSSCYDSGRLKVSSNSVSWCIHLQQGKIIYASHSVDPFDRLDCHLRRLDRQIPTLISDSRTQLRLLFETDAENELIENSTHQAICWLVNNQFLTVAHAAVLIEGLAKEVLESFLLVNEGTYELVGSIEPLTEFCRLDLQPLVKYCQKRLQEWQSLGPQIWSPYQRPYLTNTNKNKQQVSPEIQQRLSAIFKGFSLRHLAVLLNQDELKLAQSLQPYIENQTVALSEPQAPFDKLPKTYNQFANTAAVYIKAVPEVVSDHKITKENSFASISTTTQLPQVSSSSHESVQKYRGVATNNTINQIATPLNEIPSSPLPKSTYKIVCVDDSPTMLKEISRFLDDESFSVFPINDPVKALMQIIRLKPDLVLLDIKMAGIDGYELCRLLRNHSLFKNTPIIMVTGSTGIIDRVKAKFVGASGYLTKPFTQSDLLKIVFRHLT